MHQYATDNAVNNTPYSLLTSPGEELFEADKKRPRSTGSGAFVGHIAAQCRSASIITNYRGK